MKTKKTGFTLIELAIVLAILGLGVGGVLTLLTSQDERARIERTALILDGLEEALHSFYIANGRLPCPAPKNIAINAAGFGLEWNNSTAVGGDNTPLEPCLNDAADRPNNNDEIRQLHNSGAQHDEEIWIGSIPTRTLGLADRFAFDGWEGKITYAIPRALANPTDAAGYITHVGGRTSPTDDADIAKDIVIIDTEGEFSSGTTVTQDDIADNRLNPFGDPVAYVLVSHGEDKRGARNNAGATLAACNEATQDGMNCQYDLNSGITNNEYATFRDQRIEDGDITATYYYDYIRWKTLDNFTYEVSSPSLNCRRVSVAGPGPDYFSIAQCASDEYLMSGGGLCAFTSTPTSVCTSGGIPSSGNGLLHLSEPLSSMDGWQADCYNIIANADVCSVAHAICCKR